MEGGRSPIGSGKLAEVEFEVRGDALLARISGEIDSSNTGHLRSELLSRLNQDGLIIDLTAVKFIDSAGVQLLFELGSRLRSRRRRLCTIVSTTGRVRRVLEVANVDSEVPICAELSGAMRVLEQPGLA